METTANKPDGTASPFEKDSKGPKRILVQTKTHLLRGDDYGTKCYFILDLVCQHHWNRKFVFGEDRWNSYGAQLGYYNRTCYFLVDHGESATDDVPVLWYRWTGESLIAMRQTLSAEVKSKLKQYSFSRPRKEPRPKRGPPDVATRRAIIRSNLRLDIKILDPDFEFMSDPEHAEWLRDHVENRLWLKFQSLAEAHKSQQVARIQESASDDCLDRD